MSAWSRGGRGGWKLWLKWGDYEDVRAEGASEVIGLDALIHTAEAVEGDPK